VLAVSTTLFGKVRKSGSREILARLFSTWTTSNAQLTLHTNFLQLYQTSSSSGILAMGTGKKEAARKERQGKAGDGMANVKVKVRQSTTTRTSHLR
jgi:hypothetical protein